jgi:hypothetical protein
MRTTTWDYDTSTATEWLRLGGCNHCGECCKITIYLRTAVTVEDDARNGGTATDQDGLWHQWRENDEARYWKIVSIIEDENSKDCYAENNCQCTNESEWKGDICKSWPLHPSQVEVFNNCSYRFLKLRTWEFEFEPYEKEEEISKEQTTRQGEELQP